MRTFSVPLLALKALLAATTAIAQPLAEEATNITSRQVPADEIIAQILWYDGPNCDFQQSASSPLFLNVGTLSNGPPFNPNQCDPNRPPFTDTSTDNDEAMLPFTPRSFVVNSTPQTCNEDVEGGQYLGSVTLYPNCRRKLNKPTDDPSFYCPGTCTQLGWSLSGDGYGTCINVPEYADGTPPFAYAIYQRIAYC